MLKKWRLGLGGGILAAILAVLLALFLDPRLLRFTPDGEPDTGGPPIRIGHIAPLTGDAAIWGVWEREGIDLAVDEINAAGGVAGRRVSVLNEDDQGSPSAAVSALKNLISARGVRAVIGGTLSGTTLAMAPIAMENQIVLISPSAQSPKIAAAGDFIFRLFVPTNQEGAFLADLAIRSGAKSAAILYINNDYGVGLRDAVTTTLTGRITIIVSEAYGTDTRDFRTQIQKAVGTTRPDVLFLLGYQADVATILKQLAEMDIKIQAYASNSFEGEETVKIAGSAADGVIYDYPVLLSTEQADRVRAAFRNRYGRDMNVYNGVGYDAVMVLAQGMKDAKAATGQLYGTALRNALRSLRNFPGVTGPITFGTSTDVINRPLEVRTYRDGRFEKLN